MTRREELTRAREIYNKLMKEGIYQPELIAEGYRLLFPDKVVPDTLQARREFIGYHQHLFEEVFAQLDDLFSDHDETITTAPVEDKSKQSHSEDVIVDLDDKQDKPAPKKRKKRTTKKK